MAPRRRSGDAAHHITEECERLFCETLKAVFLVEKDTGLENSLVMDVRNNMMTSWIGGAQPIPQQQHAILKHGQPTPSPSPDGRVTKPHSGGLVTDYVEVWDYAGGARFRGFVTEKNGESAMFIFLDQEAMGKDLKPGLMSLLELASSERFDCSKLVVCVDKLGQPEDVQDVTRDLGWVGFELMMLDLWSDEDACTSNRWLFLCMDI